MSTRCCIRIHDPEAEGQPDCPVILYNHQDGMPERFVPKLHSLLKQAHDYLEHAGRAYWWTAERVAAVLVLLSADPNLYAAFTGLLLVDPGDLDTPLESAVPTLIPCAVVHPDIEYIYDVWLSPVYGCYRIDHASYTREEDA